MSCKILKPGLLSSIQDAGRWGHQKEGVPVNGAMDLLALRTGNLLLGKPEGAAALEVCQPGPTLAFEQNHLIAITGAMLQPRINGQPIKMWRPLWVRAGSQLDFGPSVAGRFAYLHLAGSFGLPRLMASMSTYLRGGFGGFRGRALQTGDLLPVEKPAEAAYLLAALLQQKAGSNCFCHASWFAKPHALQTRPRKENAVSVIRAVAGPEWLQFSTDSQQKFQEAEFRISNRSDRMACQLEGPLLSRITDKQLISSAVSFGTIQVPANGFPLVLLADRQTTGGYPRIAQVASVDLPVLAQLQPGSAIKFRLISLQQAQRLYIEQEQQIARLKNAIHFKLKETAWVA